MSKKTSSSVSRFASLIHDVDQKELDKVYNRTEKNDSKSVETSGKVPLSSEKEDISLPVGKKEEIIVEAAVERVGVEKEEKKKKGKEEKKKYDISYKLTKEADKAIFILSNSEEFPVRGKNEMVDYIILKFIEKKSVREILDQGIKW